MVNIYKNKMYIGTSIFFPERENHNSKLMNLEDMQKLQTYINNRNDILRKAEAIVLFEQEKYVEDTKKRLIELQDIKPVIEVAPIINLTDLLDPAFHTWENVVEYLNILYSKTKPPRIEWMFFGDNHINNEGLSATTHVVNSIEKHLSKIIHTSTPQHFCYDMNIKKPEIQNYE